MTELTEELKSQGWKPFQEFKNEEDGLFQLANFHKGEFCPELALFTKSIRIK